MNHWLIHEGDALSVLRMIEDNSVNCVCTSPPYWGLRSYGIPALAWGGDPNCLHNRLGEQQRGRRADVLPSDESSAGRLGTRADVANANDGGRFCQDCGAWIGSLGLEPNPAMYIDHMVEIFREVRRVLHPSGTLWLNLGDCYVTKPIGHGSTYDPKYPAGRNRAEGFLTANRSNHPERDLGIKSKDLVMMPARVALALQADGWYLRSQIPWIKDNVLPESVTDRPTSAIEYVYLFSKNEEYFYDREAVQHPQAEHERTRRLKEQSSGLDTRYSIRRNNSEHGQVAPGRNGVARSVEARQALAVKGTRAMRNSDWFGRGMIVDGAGDPLAIKVNPQPFALEMCDACETIYDTKEYRRLPVRLDDDGNEVRVCTCGEARWTSHFATFPIALVTPMVLAGTSEHGVCSHCAAPYERIVTKPELGDWNKDPSHKNERGAVASMDPSRKITPATETLGWNATCEHPLFPAERVPALVLDPFSGSGRTGLAALALGRRYLGIEMNAHYIAMAEWARERLANTDAVVSTGGLHG